MFVIREIRIDEDVADARFACDLAACKGACCTLPGGRGAPLQDREAAMLESVLPVVRKYLPPGHLKVIERSGMVEGDHGDRTTVCVDRRACVFVCYEDGIARCSIEKAYFAGEIPWRKPMSCHLFPLRVSPGPGSGMRYERISECSSAVALGRRKDVPLHTFLRDALVRSFGEEWYDDFRKECERREGLQPRHRNIVERLTGGA